MTVVTRDYIPDGLEQTGKINAALGHRLVEDAAQFSRRRGNEYRPAGKRAIVLRGEIDSLASQIAEFVWRNGEFIGHQRRSYTHFAGLRS